jgi:peptidoglycan/LPS O-acetylase OafA/YrhL
MAATPERWQPLAIGGPATTTFERPGPASAGLPRLGYRPALDGIRAVAILAVLGYHAGTALVGGFIGVDIFFVLSGFLITTLLLEEHGKSGHVSLRDFYERRARRLLPALAVTIIAVGVIYAVKPNLNNGLDYWAAAVSVLFYAGNWVAAFAQNPVAVLSLLDHTWSLAIEEQFYIVWPLVLLLCLRLAKPRERLLLAAVALALAVSSAILRTALWYAHTGSHIYFRTDTHADGLLLGCTLGAIYSTSVGSVLVRRISGSIAPAIVAASALLLVGFTVHVNDAFLYNGGLSLVAVASVLLIAHVVVSRSLLTRILEVRPIVWVGARSYAMYLFHIPIFAVIASTRPGSQTPRFVIPFEIALTMFAAALSYRWIESPFLRRRTRSDTNPPHIQHAPSLPAEPSPASVAANAAGTD